MSTEKTSNRLYIAPAASGKTTALIREVRAATRNLRQSALVCVPNPLQARAVERRLAEAGGAMGVHVVTFDVLYRKVLLSANLPYTELVDQVEYRLIRAIVDDLGLTHFAALAGSPGFIQSLQALFAELKGAQVEPDSLKIFHFSEKMEYLDEIARIYEAYQARLQQEGWVDRAGLGWLALEVLDGTVTPSPVSRAKDIAVGRGEPNVNSMILSGSLGWAGLWLDGFDSFTGIQLALIGALSQQGLPITAFLTGDLSNPDLPQYRKFRDTQNQLETLLKINATPLPPNTEYGIRITDHGSPFTANCQLLAVPTRAAEARTAVRWLKQQIVANGWQPSDVAILARHMGNYQSWITQIADEYGLPITSPNGLPLRFNPAVMSLLDLVGLMVRDEAGESALPRKGVLTAWRSPYFDWEAQTTDNDAVGIVAGDAELLDTVARQGHVIGGRSQWDEAFELLALRSQASIETDEEVGVEGVISAELIPPLAQKFSRFTTYLTPPNDAETFKDYVGWLENLIGTDPALNEEPEPHALNIVRMARQHEYGARDVAALQAFKEVLRGLVWAEEAVGVKGAVTLERFLQEVNGAVEAAGYRPKIQHPSAALVTSVVQARGLRFKAVAILGMGEGEFPAVLREDPFLRDMDRRRLRRLGYLIEDSTESVEREYFYEATTRHSDALLLTRATLADNGAEWEPSPFWTEMGVEPQRVMSTRQLAATEAASVSELLVSLAQRGDLAAGRWVRAQHGERWERLQRSAEIVEARVANRSSAYDGRLDPDYFQENFGPTYTWSASQIETYRSCAYRFFVSYVAQLEPRPEPQMGLDVRQLGTIYHRILERVYERTLPHQRDDLEVLLATLPEVAREVLDAAPREEGFRPNPWWQQTRNEILATLQKTIEALHEEADGFTPVQFERKFDRLILREGEHVAQLRGVVDRIDRNPEGEYRIIDYKTAGSSGYKEDHVRRGEKLQLVIYALGVRAGLRDGKIADGFYWHIGGAEPSPFKLADFGVGAAIRVVLRHVWDAVGGVRRGDFRPKTPPTGCPNYCPAAAFCWHYQPRW